MSKKHRPTKWRHSYDIGFDVRGSTTPNGGDVTGAMLRAAIKQRLDALDDRQLERACENGPFDSEEED